MIWTPVEIKCFIVSAILLIIVKEAEVSGKCKRKNLKCYDCDNRYDVYCDIPFNQSLPPKPRTRECDGCCVAFLYPIPEGGLWIQRSCTDVALIDYFMGSIEENCTNKKMKPENCFCESNFCNGALTVVDLSPPDEHISTDRAPSHTTSPFYNDFSLKTNRGNFIKMPTMLVFKLILILGLLTFPLD